MVRTMSFRRGVSTTQSAPLNWRRGMFRFWVLVSAAWIMSWAIYLILSAMEQALTTPEDFLAIPIVWALRGFKSEENPDQSTARPSHDKVVQLRQDDTDDYVS